ncbi:MAG TPA: sialidase family protein, partial [Gemmataceae bacterium]|nr:sialidase family protein [Gemmataceae bacterium]
MAAIFLAASTNLAFNQEKANERAKTAHQVVRVSDPDARGPVEVSVAIDPTNPDHIVAVMQQSGTKGAPGSNHSYVSTDAGKSWKTSALANPHQRIQGDDAVTFTADGLAVRTYISFLGIRTVRPNRAANGIWVATSRDGLTWNDSVAVIDHVNTVHPYEDKPWIKADTNKDSPHKGNIYVTWTQFDEYGSKKPEHKTHVYVSRSKDQGKTFSVPHRISETPGDCVDSSKTVMGAVPAVGPKGEVYAAWAGPKGLTFVKSSNGGYTFGAEKVLTDTPGAWDFAIKGLFRCNGLPSMGVDLSTGKHRGTIHVNWADLRNGDPDIFVMSSSDGGETWTKPWRVNDDPVKNGKEQFFTWMAVDPADGSVNIVFFDRRDTEGTQTGVTLARSVDGGKTFVNHKIDQPDFECRKGSFFGDYIGIDAYRGRVVACYQHFTDKRIIVSAAIFN